MLLPVGLWYGMTHEEGMTREIAYLIAGALSFVIGRAIAGSGER